MNTMTRIVDTLTAQHIAAFLPGRHEGMCTSAYVAVEDGGVIQTGKTTGRHVYTLTAMVPFGTPSAMGALLNSIRSAMRAMPTLRPTGEQSPDMIDEERGAYCVTVEYSALCSL